MRFRTCGLKRIQLSVTSATCVHAQQLFMLLLVATKVALPINGVKPVQAIAQEPIGNSVETLAHDKPQALHHICEAMAHGGFFSGAVLVAENSHVIYRKAFGLANREWKIPNSVDTKFRLASVSKQFCSMIIMQLIQEDKLDLNDPITKHLLYYRKDQGEKITLHHLLAHQSGIPADVEAIILKCLEKKPEDRIASAVQLRDALIACKCSRDWTAQRASQWWNEQKPSPTKIDKSSRTKIS